MSSIGPEPRVMGSKFSNFLIPLKTRNVNNFFKKFPASKWSLETYINDIIEGPDSDLTFDQILTNFIESLKRINKLSSIPLSIRSFCDNHVKWLKSLSGKAIIQSCREFFDAKRNLENKIIINSVVEKSVNVVIQTNNLQAFLQPSAPSGTEAQQSMPLEIQEDTCYITSDDNDDKDTNDDDHISDNKSTCMKDPDYFNSLMDNVELIGREEETMPACLTPTISVINSWNSFKIDDIDVVEFFGSLRDSLPKKSPEVHPQYWGVLDLTGQHKPTKKKFVSKWDELVNDFQLNIAWKMVELDQSEIDFFDNIEDLKAQQKAPILHAHLTILKAYLEHLKLPINERELMIHIVAPAFRMRPVLEGFICEVSGGLPAGCPKKIWIDKLKIMVGMRDMINRIIKTFPGLLPEDYMKIVVFGCQVIGLQMNLYAMDIRTYGIYRFGIIDKIFLPASTPPAYEPVHVMLRSLEHRLSNLTDYCSELKVKHARLRRKRNNPLKKDEEPNK
ncbi:5021_t:CDS:2 [Paraglomus brasilianum]|uniref:5021_t:CDS:1 n=1 Tax=Paraglomus brasilianum TaxID=144538 RepID=A0A9N8WKV6_9GLOM|nr:5021_t:CDS:2 [Paraglomus brasilianum]